MAKKKEAEHHCCEKMCAMTCCPCHLDIKKLKPLVRNPKFICKACGRVAADKKLKWSPKTGQPDKVEWPAAGWQIRRSEDEWKAT